MFKRTLIISLYIVWSALCMAQTFSFSNPKNGFAYTPKGDCLLLTDSTDASIVFTSKSASIYDCKCYKIEFKTEGEELIIDTFVISNKDYTVATDSQSVTLKIKDANIGYLFEYGGDSCDIDRPCHAFTWVTPFTPIDSVFWDKDTVICSNPVLYFSPLMSYKNEFGGERKINRTLSVSFQSFLADGNGGTTIGEVTKEYSGIADVMLDDIPYVNTVFNIKDLTLGTSTQEITTDTFYTQAVVAYPYMITSAKQKHEGDEGKDTISVFYSNPKEALNNASNFRNSGALTLNFFCNSNEMANHYEWAIVRGVEANQSDFRNAFVLFEKDINAYVLSDPDIYCIELTVSNIKNDSICKHKSYNCLKIAESMLQIPNAFTPNDDGINDEFKVAYRSIETFYISIYDSWGRRVYESEDITQGWDGKINDRLGSIGTYYYVVKAKGIDGVEYKEKGSVNLIRSKK